MDIPQKDKIIAVISIFCPNAKIYLFGSYVRGDVRRSSDIDIAIDNQEKLSFLEINQIRHMIDVLNIIPSVDVVDFNRVPIAMQENIIKDGIVWKK